MSIILSMTSNRNVEEAPEHGQLLIQTILVLAVKFSEVAASVVLALMEFSLETQIRSNPVKPSTASSGLWHIEGLSDIQATFQDNRKVLGEIPIRASEQRLRDKTGRKDDQQEERKVEFFGRTRSQFQVRYSAVQHYIHDFTSEIGEHTDNITVNRIAASASSLFGLSGKQAMYPQPLSRPWSAPEYLDQVGVLFYYRKDFQGITSTLSNTQVRLILIMVVVITSVSYPALTTNGRHILLFFLAANAVYHSSLVTT
ncbi:hypothetical protein EDD22DRAFT_994580 [Suillus occidentalis]|nr:hypothetical protein EDD22DRAFT_994580 [Suillus occidentalis]